MEFLFNRSNGPARRHRLPTGPVRSEASQLLEKQAYGSSSLTVNCLLHVYHCVYCE